MYHLPAKTISMNFDGFAKIMSSSIWADDASRHKLWDVVSHKRVRLGLDIYPHIQTAFAKLHRYFAKVSTSTYPMWVLVTASIVSSSKTFENLRHMSDIFRSLLAYIREIKDVRSILELEDATDRKLTSEELDRVMYCEMDILEAQGFMNPKIPLAYDFFQDHIRSYLIDMPEFSEIDTTFFKYQCTILCHRSYNILPLDLVAVVSILEVLQRTRIPDEVQTIANDIMKKYEGKIEPIRKLVRIVVRMFEPHKAV